MVERNKVNPHILYNIFPLLINTLRVHIYCKEVLIGVDRRLANHFKPLKEKLTDNVAS